VRLASVREANHTEEVQPMLNEHIYLSGDADQTNLILRLVIDQKRRVDVEEELRRRTEVVPVTVVGSSSPGR